MVTIKRIVNPIEPNTAVQFYLSLPNSMFFISSEYMFLKIIHTYNTKPNDNNTNQLIAE